jgi:hypothetical protein
VAKKFKYVSAEGRRAERAVEVLLARGLLPLEAFEQAKALVVACVNGDYVPRNPTHFCPADESGEGVKDYVNPRRLPFGSEDRCGRPRSYDPQSGPIYCGQPADVMAESASCDGAVYVLCAKCWGHTGLPLPAA